MSGNPPPKGGALLSEQQFHKILDALDTIINGGEAVRNAEEAKKTLLQAAKGEYD